MPSTADEIRGKSRREVTSPHTGNVYLIRDYSGMDAVRHKALPVVDELSEKSEGQERDLLAWEEMVVEVCAISPKVTRDVEKQDSETVHILDIQEDIAWLAGECMEKLRGKLEALTPESR